jgi:predicted RNA methylase
MPFRVLIVGSSSFRDYPKLRSILDIALSKRLPDVVLVTTGGSGLPALVASHARSRNLAVEVVPIERYPLDVRKSPKATLIGKVDAAVIVWPEIDCRVVGGKFLLAVLPVAMILGLGQPRKRIA